MANEISNHTIVALMRDKPGVLNRISSMIRRRGYNIVSLTVGHSEQPGFSRMTFVVEGDAPTIQQVRKQMDKLIDVVKVDDISNENIILRELALVKTKATAHTRSEIIQIVDIFRANIIDVSPDSLVIEVTGDDTKVDSLLQLLKPFGIQEIMRTGRVATLRGTPTLSDSNCVPTNEQEKENR